MKKILKNSNGFSLLEMVIVLGIMAASATYFMSMQQNIIKAQKSFEVKNDLELMINSMKLNLANEESCINTMDTAASVGKIETGNSIDKIISSTKSGARELFVKGEEYYNTIEIEDIKLAEVQINVSGSEKVGQFEFEIHYTKTSPLLNDSTVYIKKIGPFDVQTQMDDTVTKCSGSGALAAYEGIKDEIKEEMCQEDGGTWDLVAKTCDKPEGGLELSQEVSLNADKKGTSVLGSTEEYELCFVTGFRLETLKKGSNPDFGCQVYKSGGNWVLEVPASFRTRGESQCKAQCMNICNGPRDGYFKVARYGPCEQDKNDKQYYQAVYYNEVKPKCGSTKYKGSGPPKVSCTPCLSPNLYCPAMGNQCVRPDQCKKATEAGGGVFEEAMK